MDTLICAGGSGARVLDAVLHLCAAGLGPPQLRAFIIDPDSKNGNGEDTGELVKQYQRLHAEFGGGPLGFFGTKLDVLRPEGDDQGLQVWSPVERHQQFRKVLNYTKLTPVQKDVVHLLFTEGELDMEMEIGYLGHPALGAAALALLPLLQNNVKLLSTFAAALRNDVSTGVSNVVIAGSIFGGTGASTIHPMVRYLRSKDFIEKNPGNLKVAAVAMVPYFQFANDPSDPNAPEKVKREAAKSEDFPLASRSAAEYYDHLRLTRDWDFDAMYWVGDDSPSQVQFAPGGERQNNPGHFVDLLAALATMDFFSNQPQGGSCWYCGPDVPEGSKENLLNRTDLPMRGSLFGQNRDAIMHRLETFQMMALAHLGFYAPLFADDRLSAQAHHVPWYRDRFSSRGESLTSKTSAASLARLEAYWRNEYLPWWEQVHDSTGRVRLLNTLAWTKTGVDCGRLGNLLYPDAAQHTWDTVDELFNNMVLDAKGAADDPAPAKRYFLLLAQAANHTLNPGPQSVARA